MVCVRYLLAVSLTSTLFITLTKAVCIQGPPCLKTRVLQSSPVVPETKCTACDEIANISEQQDYVRVPSIQDESNYDQPPISYQQPSDAHDGSYQEIPPSYAQDVIYQETPPNPDCDSQPNYYISTQVINYIKPALGHQKPRSDTQVSSYGGKINQKLPTYHTQSIDNGPSYYEQPKNKRPGNQGSSYQVPRNQGTSYQGSSYQQEGDQWATPLHHLKANKIARRPNYYKPSVKSYDQYQTNYDDSPIATRQQPYAPQSTQTSYETENNDAVGMSYQQETEGRKKSVPVKQGIEISCQKCKKTGKSKRSSRVRY